VCSSVFSASNAEIRALGIAILLSGGVTVELEELFAGGRDVENKLLRAGLVRETLGCVGEGSIVIDLDERRGEVEGIFKHYPPTCNRSEYKRVFLREKVMMRWWREARLLIP
jgi:hypothetical protein